MRRIMWLVHDIAHGLEGTWNTLTGNEQEWSSFMGCKPAFFVNGAYLSHDEVTTKLRASEVTIHEIFVDILSNERCESADRFIINITGTIIYNTREDYLTTG